MLGSDTVHTRRFTRTSSDVVLFRLSSAGRGCRVPRRTHPRSKVAEKKEPPAGTGGKTFRPEPINGVRHQAASVG